jgi:hypothetical protein
MCRKLLSWAWVTCLLWVPELVVKSIVKSHRVHIYDIPFIPLRFLWSGQFVYKSSLPRWRASEIHHCSGNVVHWQGLSTQLA